MDIKKVFQYTLLVLLFAASFLFYNKYFTENVEITEFIEGTMINLFWEEKLGDNEGHWEITSKNENQLVGGQTTGDYNFSVVCEAYLTRLSHLNIERVRSI